MKLHELTTPNKIQEAIADCMQRKIQLTENVFRAGSDAYFETFRVAREMLAKGQLVVDDNMREMLEQTDIGEFYTMKDGTLLPLDCPMVEEESVDEADFMKYAKDAERGVRTAVDVHSKIDAKMAATPNIANTQDYQDYASGNQQRKIKAMRQGMPYGRQDGPGTGANATAGGALKPLFQAEAEYQGKDVELNKPKRGGSKKYYVYVKNPKTGKVKKINFGDAGGLTAKINDPAAKRSFVARHKCKQKNDKTKAGYWACRLPRYAKSLGLKGGGAWW